MIGCVIKKQLMKLSKEKLIEIIEDAFNINQDLTKRVNMALDILRGDKDV